MEPLAQDGSWTEKKILILGMTYPSYSIKYQENVCTGGIDEDTNAMVRIHPVPRRYMEPQNRFKAFQWITAKVRPHNNDPRPESLRVMPSSIKPGAVIPSTKPDERRRWIDRSPNLVKSVEQLKERWEKDRISLAAMRPKEILGTRLAKRSAKEKAEWVEKGKELLAQKDFFEDDMKPLDFPEVTFQVKWRCDDSRCQTHEMGIQQWGLHELYRKLKGDPKREEKVLAQMHRELDMAKKDVILFLGNFRGLMYNFGLMDTTSPGKRTQLFFDGMH